MAGLAGYALLIGIALVAVLFLFAVWPRTGRAAQDALRIAEAAGKANIAWAITGEDGAFNTYAVDAHGCPRTYESKKVILSMGYYDVPNKLNVPGEDLPKVIHYYKEAHPYYNHDVLVVGAKNSAAIAALELWWTGARVTLVHRGEGIHANVKYWIKPNIENRIKNGEIPAHFRSTVLEIGETFADVDTGEMLLYEDAWGALALAVNRGHAAAMLGAVPDAEVRLTRR